mgnify:CR=1 FL=1
MATTIYTYLHNDDLNGSRIVSMDDCMCKLYNIKREDNNFLKDFNDDLQNPALYILVNKDKRKAYIGETDDFTKRIVQHLSKKDFWDEVMVFLASDGATLSKTEVQYLEFLAYNKASEMKSYDLSENTQTPKNPHMSVIQKAKTDKFFNYVQFLAKFVGSDIFEKRPNVILRTTLEAVQPKVTPVDIDYTNEDLKGRIYLSLNGEGKYTKREIVLAIVKQWMTEHDIAPYDETSHKGLVRHILTRVGFKTKEIMVCLIINGTKLPHSENLVEALREIPGMTSISYNINQEKTNVILGSKVVTLWGQDYITDYIGDVRYQISPL